MSKSKSRAEAEALSQEAESAECQSDEDGNDSLQLVERLQDFGINAGDIAKLKSAGIFTFVPTCIMAHVLLCSLSLV